MPERIEDLNSGERSWDPTEKSAYVCKPVQQQRGKVGEWQDGTFVSLSLLLLVLRNLGPRVPMIYGSWHLTDLLA